MPFYLSYHISNADEQKIINDAENEALYEGDKRLDECLVITEDDEGIDTKEIANNIQIFYTMGEVVKYMNEHHNDIRGWAQRTMAKWNKEEPYIKNGFKLTFFDSYLKIRKTPAKVKKYIPRLVKIENRITFYEMAKTNRQKPLIFNSSSYYLYRDILEFIQSIDNADNKIFMIILDIETETEEKNENNEVVIVKRITQIKTPYTFYNNIYNKLVSELERYNGYYELERYKLNKIRIQTKNLIPLIDQIIYKNTNGNYDKLINKYSLLSELKENKNIYEDELYNNIKNCRYIISPKTYNKCLLSCILMGVYNKENIKKELDNKKITDKIYNYNIQDCKLIIKLLHDEFKNMNFIINVYFISDIIHNFKCIDIDNINKTDKIINLLINRNHAHLMINDEDFKENDIEEHKKEVINKELIIKPSNKINDYYKHSFNILLNSDNEIIKINTYDEFNIYNEYLSIDSFLSYIKNLKSPSVFYIHNGKSKFYLLLKSILTDNDLSIYNFLEDDNKILNVELKNKNKYLISFRDSMNFLNNYSIYQYIKDFDIKTYNNNDEFKNNTLYLLDILNKINNLLIKNYKLTILDGLTSSSISRKIFLNKYYNNNIYKISSLMERKMRLFYHGGRNELYKIGCIKSNIYHYDFTSFYPSIMYENKYPINKMNIIKISNKNIFDKNWFGIVKCRIRHINKNKMPFHAIKDDDKNIIYPYIDNFYTVLLTTEEIKYSLDNNLGYEYQYIKVYNYDNKDYIFKEFINNLFTLKQEAEKKNNSSLKELSKTIINASYGFWGFNTSDKEQVVINSNEKKNKKGKSDEYIKRKIDNNKNQYEYAYINSQRLIDSTDIGKYNIYKIRDVIDFKCNNIIISMFISSYARLKLYDLMTDIQNKKGQVIYVDTDGIMTDINLSTDKNINKKFIKKNKGNLGELMNEYQKEVKKILLKDNVSLTNINNYIKSLNDNECYFKNLIFISLKFYYYEIEFNYNDKLYKKEIIKTRGVNNNICFNKLIVDDNNKSITLEEESTTGQYKLNKDIFIKLSNGYTLTYDINEKKMGMKEIINNKNIYDLQYNKKISMIYDKGIINNNDILPLTI